MGVGAMASPWCWQIAQLRISVRQTLSDAGEADTEVVFL